MDTTGSKKLIFVYNADSGLRNMLIDGAHKLFRPDTYACSLCAITYGAFSENSRWKQFRKESELQMEFLHKDEFQTDYASKFGYRFEFPIVLVEAAGTLEVGIRTEDLNAMKTAEDLIDRIEALTQA